MPSLNKTGCEYVNNTLILAYIVLYSFVSMLHVAVNGKNIFSGNKHKMKRIRILKIIHNVL